MKKIIYSLLIVFLYSSGILAQSFDRSVPPSAAPAKEVNIQDAQIFTLNNGLKVFLVEDKTTPLVYYSLQLDVKPALEGNKAGMNSVFSDVFGSVTKNRSKEQLNKDIDLIGMRGGVHRTGGYAYFLKKYHDQALDIMTDMLFNPVFTQEEFDLSMTKFKTDLSSLGDDPGVINDRLAKSLIYGAGYPSGEIVTMETLDNIQLSDLESYYQTYFAPNVSRLVIVGDISQEDARKQAEKYFGKWQRKNVPVAKYIIPTAPAQRKVAFANKPGAVQSAIDVCYPITFNLKENDYDAARVMSQILGGSGNGYLFLNLREDKSWTYGIYTSLVAGEQIGSMSLTSGRGAASVKAMATDSAVFEIFNEFNRIINEPVSEDQLRNAVTYSAGAFSRSLEDSETIARFAVNIDKYGLPKDYYRNYLKRLAALTPRDIQSAARKYVKPENAWVVVTTDRQYVDNLSRFSADGKVQWFDYNANPIETPEEQDANITAEEVISNYVKAIGGKDAIEKINDYKMIGEMQMMGQTAAVEQYFKKPNLSVTSITMQGMLIQKMAFDGEILRMAGMQGSQEVNEGPEYDSIKNNAGISPEMNYLQNGYALTVGGIESINGEDAYILKVEQNGKSTMEYYSVDSGLKLRNVQTNETPMGEMQTITDYSDYREINGVKLPFTMTQSAMGQAMTTVIKSVEFNTGVDNSVFR